MTPILFPSSSSSFTSQGIGRLADALSCEVIEKRNGEYELELTYPTAGAHFEEIKTQMIILAKPNTFDDPQPFRIYQISKPLEGICEINARHISYDLSGVPVVLPNAPITATSVGQAFTLMKANSAVTNNFTFTSDISTASQFSINHAASFRSIMGGVEGSLLDVFGGEYHYDGFNVELLAARGADRGFSIRYGKNLTDLEQEEKCSNCYTGVLAYYQSDTDYVQGTIQTTGLTPGYDRVLVLDLSQDFGESVPTQTQLDDAAQAYIVAHNMIAPEVSITLSFVQLDNSPVERISLCDIVSVYFETLGVEASAKVVETEYNVLENRYERIKVGSVRANLADEIVTSEKVIKSLPTKSSMRAAIDRATELITGNSGGYVVTVMDENGEPQELLVMDTADISTATKVWRWNKGGLGYSSTGYSGNYALAMTSDGEIVADRVKTGTLQSRSEDGSEFTLDLDSGTLVAVNPSIYFGADALTDQVAQIGLNKTAIEDISGYLSYSNGIVTIGDSASDVSLVVKNDRIAFKDKGTGDELAYFSNNRLYITDATITNSMDIGDYRIDTSAGGLTFKWVG